VALPGPGNISTFSRHTQVSNCCLLPRCINAKSDFSAFWKGEPSHLSTVANHKLDAFLKELHMLGLCLEKLRTDGTITSRGAPHPLGPRPAISFSDLKVPCLFLPQSAREWCSWIFRAVSNVPKPERIRVFCPSRLSNEASHEEPGALRSETLKFDKPPPTVAFSTWSEMYIVT
jgi:hypothetical protein